MTTLGIKKTATHRRSVDSFFLRSFTIQQIDKLPLKEDGGHLKGFLHSVEFVIQESIFQGQNLKKKPLSICTLGFLNQVYSSLNSIFLPAVA